MLSGWSMVSNHHSLGQVELETLKAYIETNLANRFIRPSKCPAGAPIFFNRKLDGSLQLCVDCRGLNNLTIALSISMARTVTIAITVSMAMTGLTPQDKLEKV